MADTRPVLVTFATSHYCEKARWALDWHNIPYREQRWLPGLHQVLAKQKGAQDSSLPLLLTGDGVVQGSTEIVDWAEAQGTASGPSLAPRADQYEAAEIERRADTIIGVNVRRFAYAALLPERADDVRDALFARESFWHRAVGAALWPVTSRLMMRLYAVTPEAGEESGAALEDELDLLDARLADGRQYLAGDRFSRADLSVASLLGALARPKEIKVYSGLAFPPPFAARLRAWNARPIMHWVRAQYARHRGTSSVPDGVRD